MRLLSLSLDAAGFSLMCLARYAVFIPPERMDAALGEARTAAYVYVLVAALAAAASRHFHSGIDTHFVLSALFAALYARTYMLPSAKMRKDLASPHRSLVSVTLAVTAALMHGVALPVLGLQNMSALTMYGNLKHWGGSNHLLVPTNLLADIGPALGLEAFRGLNEVVRVDSAESAVLNALSPADTTAMTPARAQSLLRGAGASPKYFGAYCARMFWGREADLPVEGTIGNDVSATAEDCSSTASPPPYALTSYELRRVLAMAREHGERFRVTYTRLPPELSHGTPAAWRDFRGDSITLEEDPMAGSRLCTAAGGRECSASERVHAFAGSPAAWLTKVLMAYPIPLLPDSGSEIHCSA